MGDSKSASGAWGHLTPWLILGIAVISGCDTLVPWKSGNQRGAAKDIYRYASNILYNKNIDYDFLVNGSGGALTAFTYEEFTKRLLQPPFLQFIGNLPPQIPAHFQIILIRNVFDFHAGDGDFDFEIDQPLFH